MPKEEIKPEFSPKQIETKSPLTKEDLIQLEKEKREKEDAVIQPEKIDETHIQITRPSATIQKEKSVVQAKVKSQNLKNIEAILSQDLKEIYQNMPDDLKKEFKSKGEETASKIENLLNQTKVIVYKIVNLIKNWLLMIPGVNKFFLEQEAKIKTEKILALKNKEKNKTLG